MHVVVANEIVLVAMMNRFGRWYQTTGGLLGGAVTNGNITAIAPAAAPAGNNGVIGTLPNFPSSNDGSHLPALDVVFLPT